MKEWERKLREPRAIAAVSVAVVLLFGAAAYVSHRVGAATAPAAPVIAAIEEKQTPPQMAAHDAEPVKASPPAAHAETKTSKFGAWDVNCREETQGEDKKTACVGVLQIVEKKSKQVLLVWLVGKDRQGRLAATLQTPTGIRVSSGIDLALGSAPARKVPYDVCVERACNGSFLLDAKFVAAAGRAEKAQVTIVAANGKSLSFGIPMAGFDRVIAGVELR